MTELRCLFRIPVFPVIFKDGSKAVCATTRADLESYIERNAADMPSECELVDKRWEGWILYPKEAALSPSMLKRRYSKRDLLLLCCASEEQVSSTNLNRYSREDVFEFLVQQSRQKA